MSKLINVAIVVKMEKSPKSNVYFATDVVRVLSAAEKSLQKNGSSIEI